MTEMTQAEIARAFRRIEESQRDLVAKEVYERDLKQMQDDISEIKESLKWATRFIAGLFVTVILQLAFVVISQAPLP